MSKCAYRDKGSYRYVSLTQNLSRGVTITGMITWRIIHIVFKTKLINTDYTGIKNYSYIIMKAIQG